MEEKLIRVIAFNAHQLRDGDPECHRQLIPLLELPTLHIYSLAD